MKPVPIATFNELGPAQHLCQRLGEVGIQAFIHDESKLERLWFMSEPLAAIHVEVHQPDYLKARRVIREWEPEDQVLRAAVRCPECGSSRVEFPQITRKFLTPVIEAFLMAVHWLPREYYCLDCQYTWPKEPRPELERDILGWPRHSKQWHPEEFRSAQHR